jgi:hypothetical protein
MHTFHEALKVFGGTMLSPRRTRRVGTPSIRPVLTPIDFKIHS